MSDEHSDDPPAGETLEGEDALKGADIKSGIGQDEVNEQQSGAATSGATEQNPNVEGPDVGGP